MTYFSVIHLFLLSLHLYFVSIGRSRKILLVYSGAAPTSKSYIDDKCSSYHVKIIMNCGSLSAKPMELVYV